MFQLDRFLYTYRFLRSDSSFHEFLELFQWNWSILATYFNQFIKHIQQLIEKF